MKYCLASSREKTTIFSGHPISPVSRRLTSVLPSEPVPPVIRILLPSRGRTSIPPFIGGRVLNELGDQFRPGRRLVADGRAELVAAHAAVRDLGVLGRDRDIQSVGVADTAQQVEFRYGLGHRLV